MLASLRRPVFVDFLAQSSRRRMMVIRSSFVFLCPATGRRSRTLRQHGDDDWTRNLIACPPSERLLDKAYDDAKMDLWSVWRRASLFLACAPAQGEWSANQDSGSMPLLSPQKKVLRRSPPPPLTDDGRSRLFLTTEVKIHTTEDRAIVLLLRRRRKTKTAERRRQSPLTLGRPGAF